jgi:hypothetical protein
VQVISGYTIVLQVVPLWHPDFGTNNLLLLKYMSQLITSFWDIGGYCYSRRVDQSGEGGKKVAFC